MKSASLSFFFLLIFIYTQASDSLFIKIHFRYGSVPAKGYKDTERKYFGGILGGHVEIEIDEQIVGFVPKGEFHVFGSKKEIHSTYYKFPVSSWVKDTSRSKFTSITLGVSEEQHQKIKQIHQEYLNESPYDYAFFGYRCASSTYDILARAGILPEKSYHATARRIFYPRRLRNHLAKLLPEENYNIFTHKGRASRRWERDIKRTKKKWKC